MNKIIVFDLETTGLANACGVHQISMLVVVNNQLVEIITHDVSPGEVLYSQEALDIANKTIEQIKAQPPIDEVLPEINEKIVKHLDDGEKWMLCGYNNRRFDNRFIKAMYSRHMPHIDFNEIYHDDTIDVMMLSKEYFKTQETQPQSFKLIDVAKHLGIEISEELAHRAEYDAMITFEILTKINIQPDGKDA